MDKTKRLTQATADFRDTLEAAALLGRLTPLFARIEPGEVLPPATGPYKAALHYEHPWHGAGTPLFRAESAFIAALEDWRSQPWYPR
ncbi:MAG: hypothetical protein H6932_12715 [Burkholderiaceae bacterium]|nr:hypothetical protein [Burkholderiaceae bacterium]